MLLSELLDGGRTIPVPIGKVTVTVTYDPNRLSLAYRRTLGDKKAEVFIAEVVTSWSIDDVDPTDPDAVATIAPAVVSRIIDAVVLDRPLD